MDEEEEEGGVTVEDYEDDDDIYGDLESDIFAASAAKRIRVDDVKQHEDYQNLVTENLALKSKNKKLQKENKTYCDNISALYLTAKNEIDKKNFIIKNLTEKLKQVTQSKSTISHKETEDIFIKCQEGLQESQAQVTLNEIKECLKKVPAATDGNKKHIKFGNMSLYFFREQVPFQREESVKFPEPSTSVEIPPPVPAQSQQSVEKLACGERNREKEKSHTNGSNYGRNREKSPPTDRYHRKLDDDDRYKRRERDSREYESRRSETFKGWRSHDSRTRPQRQKRNDTKSYSSTNGKYSRSRSKSK